MHERLFRALANSIPQFVWVAEPSGGIFWYNDRWYEYTGTTLEEMQGWGWRKVHHPDHVDRVVKRIRHAFETGEPWEDTFPLRSRTGAYRWFLSRAVPIRDADGHIVRWFGTNTDVTEQRAAAAERELLADMIPQHIWTTDPDGYHGYFSRRWYEYTGATLEQTEGQGWLEVLHPDDRERTLSRWHHSLRTGEPYAIEYRFRGADGQYRWFLGQAMPLRNEAGQIVRWFGTLTDISERKQHEEDRERLLSAERDARADAERRRDELERVTESRARLMRGFSHDLKNPLGAADGYLHLMTLMDSPTAKQAEKVGKARRSIKAALNLIEDLLELARAEAGEIEIERAPTDVRNVVRDASDEYRAQAEAAKLSMTVDLRDGLPTIESDASRIRQVLGNLISNAVKYTVSGGITVRVDVRETAKASGAGPWIAVDVSDTGPGISPDQQQLLFREFRRLDSGGQAKGAGIGLAISRHIAQALGGDITVASELGKGSTFTLWLPIDAVA